MRTPNKIPDCESLAAKFRYDPKTGFLFRLFKGKEKKITTNSNGYIVTRYGKTSFYAHRIVWKIFYKKDPDGQIDHINGIKSDNRIENLRDVSEAINSRNLPLRRDNKSGVSGVYWHSTAQKWAAEIHLQSEKKYLGLFKNKTDAIKARKAAETELGFHVNHGR